MCIDTIIAETEQSVLKNPTLCVCSGSRWLLPDQRVRQPVSDPELGPGAAALRLPDAGGPGGAEGVEQPTEPRRPEAEGEPAEPGRERVF